MHLRSHLSERKPAVSAAGFRGRLPLVHLENEDEEKDDYDKRE